MNTTHRPSRATRAALVLMLSQTGLSPLTAGGRAADQSYPWVQPGNHRWYYTSMLDQTLQPYHIYVPRDFDPTVAHPVVIFLHGFGGRTGTAAPDAFRQNWADSGNWLLVRADGRGSQNWDFLGEDDIFCILTDLQTTTASHPAVKIDTRRLYLEGGSMGGHGGYREAFRYPDRFAAVAPAAGWTTYREFYRHYYDRAAVPRMPQYVDPARQPVLETASSLWQAPNARHMWVYLVWDSNDSVNPQVNQQEVLKKLQAIGSDRYATRVGARGHVGSYSAPANYHFFSTKRAELKPPDVFYTTNDLRYNRSYWVRVDRLYLTRRWGSVEARVVSGPGLQRIEVKTRDVLAFSLDLEQAPVHRHRPVYVEINNGGAQPVVGQPVAHFVASTGPDYQVLRWTLASGKRPSLPRKRGELSGPICEAFRTPFTVVYGTHGGALGAGRGNPDWEAAQHFCTEWNAWMTLQWRGGNKPPADRRDDWWIPPYPFDVGAHLPKWQPTLKPLPDSGFTLESLPLDTNLILFGDPTTNWVVRQVADGLPLELSAPDSAPSIRVGSRLYFGEHVRYFFVAPNPMAPAKYVAVARGYLSSRVDPTRYGAGNVGKDLEALPFYWPDYVVWDARKRPTEAKQKPFVYLPSVWLDAGYFDEDWELDTTPPHTRIKLDPVAPNDTYPDGGRKVSLSASDAPGGFGVGGIEYRLDDGPWRTYSAPVVVAGRTDRRLSVRATDRNGQFVYDHTVTPERGLPAPGNVEPPQTITLALSEG